MMKQVKQAPKGFVHALTLNGTGGMQKLNWQEALNCDSSVALWLHFDYSDEQSQQWIKKHSGLNETAIDALLTDDSRPHVLSQNDQLSLSLRGVNLNPGSDPEDMVSLRLWTDGKRLISTRKRRLLSTVDLVRNLEEGRGPKDMPSLLIDWIERIVRRMSDTVDNLEDDLLAIEDKLFSTEPRLIRASLLQLRMQSIGIRRYIAPQREALNRLIAESLSWFDELNGLRLRSIAERQIRHIEDIDAVRERASMTKEELSSSISEQMNQRSYVLTIVAAIFLPLGFFTGLMGINVGGMPGVEYSPAFWIVVTMCLGITGVLMGLFYWKKWF
ncbi:zinc transporter ZntB [Psychromonas antarctica]|uniref:zinc transporter ZntB n=1 Tax=Psychromonas antarctica TaxID=67573 RepID=UPI001EE8C2ED|nr:zinc transporter ZntB [Psychromonas antarctica]MCG6201516.1 zinc transporter ZntB [Psychromonas antarctica]